MRIRPAQMADAASLAALSIEVWVGTYLRQGASSFFAELVLSEFTAARIEAIVDGGIDFLIFSENLDPKFSSWSKTELWQVVDVEPMPVFGKSYND